MQAQPRVRVCTYAIRLTNTLTQDRQQLRYELDLNSWNLRIWGVAASGFLTDS